MTACLEAVLRLNKGCSRLYLFQTLHQVDGLVPTCQHTWTHTRAHTHTNTEKKKHAQSDTNVQTVGHLRLSVCAFTHDTHTHAHAGRHKHTGEHTCWSSRCRLVSLMPLLCVPAGCCGTLCTCLDSSLRQDFIGQKAKLGSLRSPVNGSEYQILLLSTSLATVCVSLSLTGRLRVGPEFFFFFLSHSFHLRQKNFYSLMWKCNFSFYDRRNVLLALKKCSFFSALNWNHMLYGGTGMKLSKWSRCYRHILVNKSNLSPFWNSKNWNRARKDKISQRKVCLKRVRPFKQ